jgi:disulfide oxidoreductase YuzD
MKHILYVIVALLSFSSLVFADNSKDYPKNHWSIFSKNSAIALKSDNDGLKQAAMVNIIRYKDKINPTSVVFPLIDIYTKHQNEKMRELAVAALQQTGNVWALNYLKDNLMVEKNPQIKHLIASQLKAEKEKKNFLYMLKG